MIDIEFIDSDDEQQKPAQNQQPINNQVMQQEETPSPIFSLSNKIQHIISRRDVITVIEHIVINMLKGSMKQIRPTDVKIEPILSTSVQKACCLLEVNENMVQQLLDSQLNLSCNDKDPQKGLIVSYEFKFFDLMNSINAICQATENLQRNSVLSDLIKRLRDQHLQFWPLIKWINKFMRLKSEINRGVQLAEIREVKAMLRLQHPNVIRLYSWWVEQEINEKIKNFYLYLQQEYDSYLGCNDLLQFSVNYLSIVPVEQKRKTLKSLISQLINGLEYIHGQGFFHRDLKLENVLVTKDNSGEVALRICDFDWSKTHLNDDGQKINWLILSKECGTVEINNVMQRRGIVYDAKAELFQVGIIILDLCDPICGKEERIQNHKNAKNNQFRPHISEQYKPELQLIQALFNMEFKSVQEFKNSPLYNKYMQG